MLSESTFLDTIGKYRLSAAKAGFAGKTLIFVAIIFTGLISAGCSTTTYLNLTENNKELIENKLKYDERDEDVGAEVILSLKYGEKISGELLSVRDSTMIICTEHSATEEELASLKYPITAVRNDEMQEITIEGSDYVWIGLGIGIVVGTGIGYAAAKASNSVGGIIILVGGAIVGIIGGPIIGNALSTEEFILQEIPPGYDMTFLKPLARYPDEEPEYLREIK
jgi:hypothetical protein